MSLRDGTLLVEGWAMDSDGNKLKISMTDGAGAPVKYTAVERDRVDVMQQFGADRMCGFTVAAPFERGDERKLILTDGAVTRKITVTESVIERKNSVRTKRAEKLLALCHVETLQVAWDFYKENGLRALWKKSIHKIRKIDEDYDYPEWEAKTRISEEELAKQRKTAEDFPVKPRIDVVIPAYNTGKEYLWMLFDSFLRQTYGNLRIIVADGSEGNENVREVTEEYAAKQSGKTGPEFRYVNLSGNHGIAGNTNLGLEAADGAYIALCDHDDELPPNAFFEVVKAINENPAAEFLYTDEDKIDFDGKAVFEPHFKSDFNMDLLTSVNYICHLSVIRRDLLLKTGGFRKEFDGAQDYDFFLRCLEEATTGEKESLCRYRKELRALGKTPQELTAEEVALLSGKTGLSGKSIRELSEGRFTSEKVIHVPVICYHWRYHKGSTAENPESKLYAFEAGSRAIRAHYERCGIEAAEVIKGPTYGYYRTRFRKKDGSAATDGIKVSVIIPNKDHTEDLDKCIRSIVQHSLHRNFEFIVVENNSTDEKTFDYYRNIGGNPGYFAGESGPDVSGISVRVVKWDREFNYSAINNFGEHFATGEMLLLLNNDVELSDPDAVTDMLSYTVRPEVGITGARLCYGDDTIQHAGVIVGLGGIAGAAFVGLHEKENSYMHRMMCVQDLSAVTAACLMIRKEVFEEAGGLREELAVAFNDIDLCMKVRALGYLTVYDAYAKWHHYESKSRGLEDTPEKVRRFNNEIAVFAHYWGEILQNGDPYYNRNLTLRKANFALKDLTKETPGEPYKLELDVDKQLETVLREKARRAAAERTE